MHAIIKFLNNKNLNLEDLRLQDSQVYDLINCIITNNTDINSINVGTIRIIGDFFDLTIEEMFGKLKYFSKE